ncbi:182 kDa tankyrase-1-binding protein isoform X3 [Varanus komodoensis]|uniref:182 kDa tankyrase-1-binding protein isoform X3 n=1 Tax=Varanus komodoensis TaxID=61221 RepID=UPI001CF7D8C6|nr:182 kDa tankyrase-1-binding protein isoform X3 [Varanus komodoensis]
MVGLLLSTMWRRRLRGLIIMLSSESHSGDAMDSKPQSLGSPFPCTAANGSKGPKQPATSPETGDARPKPPVKPKPCVLPKPAMPVKPVPGLRQALSEVPSAEKMNLLAGPKPYSSGAGNAVKRLSFSLKGPPREDTNGKEVSSPFSTVVKQSGEKEGSGSAKKSNAAEGASGGEHAESCSIRESAAPFKVKPVPVAAKPERFPGTTVEEILAKIEKPSKEGPNSPDRPRLVRSFLSQDGGTAVHLGPKGYAAFRRCSSGGEAGGIEAEGPACRASYEAEENRLSKNKEETTSSNGQHVPESEQPERAVETNLNFLSRDSSSRPSMSCDGSQPGRRNPPSPPGVSYLQHGNCSAGLSPSGLSSVSGTYQPLNKLSSGVSPGSPDAPAETAQPPGAPYFPADVSCTEAQFPPGSPDAPTEVPQSPVEASLGLGQAPGSPVTLADPCPPGSPSAFLKTSLGHTLSSCLSDLPEVSLLPGQSASSTNVYAEHSPEVPRCVLGVSESPGSPSTPSEYHVGSDQPPGSPSHPQDSLPSREQDPIKNPAQVLPQFSQLVLRRASEGVVQPRGKKLTREELGGSLAVLPREGGGGPLLEQATAGESNWSLSQSFEWSFPNRAFDIGGRRLGSPPRSPIKETDDTSILETELGGESPVLQGSHEEIGLKGQSRKREEVEDYGSSACLDGSRESPRHGRKVEWELESSSALGMSAPGGPSAQHEPMSPRLQSPIVAEEGGIQVEHDGFQPFAPTSEKEALRAMEPLPNVEDAAPPAEPCILFSEDAQVQTAASCQEDNSALALAQEGKTGGVDHAKGLEPDHSSHWLDELLASPPPSADDTKRRSTPKPEDPTGPENLLGWSQKDFCSEFGFVGDDQSAFGMDWSPHVTKADWPDETEQDREFGIGTRDWLSSYSVGDAKTQDIEFGTSQQDWTRGTPLIGSSNPGQEAWLATYSNSCADQQIKESDWSSTYISTVECQDQEPYTRKPGWPKLCSAEDDQGSSSFEAEKTGWGSQYHVTAAEGADWVNKYSVEDARGLESGVNIKSSEEYDKYITDSRQDTKLGTGQPEVPDDCRAMDATSQDTTLNANQSAWPNETSAGSTANEPQTEFGTQQVEQPSENNANHPESQGSAQQQSQPMYGSSDGSCQESEMSVKVSDWSSRYDMGVTQSREGQFSVEKPEGTRKYDDKQTGWERELDNGDRGSRTEFDYHDQEFCAQKQVWADEYSLNKTDPRSGDFPAGTRDWVKDAHLSETEQKELFSVTEKDQTGSFGSFQFSKQTVTVDLEETVDRLIDQVGGLKTEAKGVGEEQPAWTQDLGVRDKYLSGDLKTESPDSSKQPAEKQPYWFSGPGLEIISASSDARPGVLEETREPGVGQADLAYSSGTESMDVSTLRPKAFDGTKEVDLIDGTGTAEHKGHNNPFGITGLDGDVAQHPETAKESRKFHNQRLSSPSHFLEEMVSNSAVKELAHQKRPASFHSYQLEAQKRLSNLPDEKARVSPSPVEKDEKVLVGAEGGESQLDIGNGSQLPEEARVLSHPEQNGSQITQPASQEGHASEKALEVMRENFFLGDTEVLDNTAYRERANLGRKRGHRAPATRSGGALSENSSWMFRDSTEPRIASPASDDEAHEEVKSRKSRNSPLSKGVKVPLFPGLSASALKAKLRGRNHSAEEGDQQSEAKDTNVQRSKSCKIANISGKSLVLPPKPEKSSGSETSSPNWLQVLKLKKKKP